MLSRPLYELQLVDDLPGVSLAVSLHAPNQELRQSIVPSARAYPLPKLMAALETYLDRSRQQKVILHHECSRHTDVRSLPSQVSSFASQHLRLMSIVVANLRRTMDFKFTLKWKYAFESDRLRQKGGKWQSYMPTQKRSISDVVVRAGSSSLLSTERTTTIVHLLH